MKESEGEEEDEGSRLGDFYSLIGSGFAGR